MKRPPLPYLLLLPLLAVLIFGNCSLLEKALTTRSTNELMGNDLRPDQLTRLRAALQLEEQLRQEAAQKYSGQPAAYRAEIKRIRASTGNQLDDFLTRRQRQLLRRHRAKIERRLQVNYQLR